MFDDLNNTATRQRVTWLVTYRHVMTLLLLFAVCLLTFGRQPDEWREMQAATFSDSEQPLEGSHLVRYRPRSARQALVGNRQPILGEQSAADSVAEGLEDLDQLSDLVRSERCEIALRKEQLIDNGVITDRGRATLRIIAAQLQRFNGHAQLIASHSDDANALISVCLQLASETKAYPATFGVSTRPTRDPEQNGRITIVVTRDIR